MKTIALTTLVLASMATLALSQESRISGRDQILSTLPLSLSMHGGVRETDSDSHPFSLSPEALPRAENESTFSIGPVAGYLQARGSDHGTWFGGVQARLRFAKFFAAEASITFHSSRYEGGDVEVTQYPVQLTAFFYPIPEGQFRPYILGGVGWYYTRTDYKDGLSYIDNTTDSLFGEHLGAGLELMLGSRTSLDFDIRYIFLNPSNNQVIDLDYNYWQITLGLNFFL